VLVQFPSKKKFNSFLFSHSKYHRNSRKIYKSKRNLSPIFPHYYLQTQSKASTISSGARAAAATLNVPIERLEAQIHQHTNSHSPINEKQHMNGHDENNLSLEHNIRESSASPSNFQNLHHPVNSGLNNSSRHKTSTVSQQEIIVREDESSPTQTSLTKHSLLQFAIQHFRNE
jgi:hypothetical protein